MREFRVILSLYLALITSAMDDFQRTHDEAKLQADYTTIRRLLEQSISVLIEGERR